MSPPAPHTFNLECIRKQEAAASALAQHEKRIARLEEIIEAARTLIWNATLALLSLTSVGLAHIFLTKLGL